MCFVSWCNIFGQEFLVKTTSGTDALWGVRLGPGDFTTHNLSQSTTVLNTMLYKHIVARTKRSSFCHYSDIIWALRRPNSRALQLFVLHIKAPPCLSFVGNPPAIRKFPSSYYCHKLQQIMYIEISIIGPGLKIGSLSLVTGHKAFRCEKTKLLISSKLAS